MKKTYQVAGHKFSVTMPDGNSLWNEMGQYEPFLSDESGQHVFEVTLDDEMPDLEGWNKVTEEKNQFFPVFEFYECNEGWLWSFSKRKLIWFPIRHFRKHGCVLWASQERFCIICFHLCLRPQRRIRTHCCFIRR